MWYLAWILGVGFAVAFAAFTAMRQEQTPGDK
jgi:cyd operon protein YbgT